MPKGLYYGPRSTKTDPVGYSADGKILVLDGKILVLDGEILVPDRETLVLGW